MDAIESLFRIKTEEATRILASRNVVKATKEETELPFEVNKVIGRIKEETVRRAKLSKRKPNALEYKIKDKEDAESN